MRRALGPQVLANAERLISAWNARHEAHMPMLFSPAIGAAIAARHWFLWVRCSGCRTVSAVDLRGLDRHPDAAVTSLIPLLSCRSCRPHAPFAEWSGYRKAALPMKCGRSVRAGYWWIRAGARSPRLARRRSLCHVRAKASARCPQQLLAPSFDRRGFFICGSKERWVWDI